jgi:hypothetical protein
MAMATRSPDKAASANSPQCAFHGCAIVFFPRQLSNLLGSTHTPDRVIKHFTQGSVPDSVFEWSGLRNRDYSAFSHWSHASSQSTAPIIIPLFFPLAP